MLSSAGKLRQSACFRRPLHLAGQWASTWILLSLLSFLKLLFQGSSLALDCPILNQSLWQHTFLWTWWFFLCSPFVWHNGCGRCPSRTFFLAPIMPHSSGVCPVSKAASVHLLSIIYLYNNLFPCWDAPG